MIALDNALMNSLNTATGGVGSLTISRGVGVVDTMSNLNLAGRFINFGNVQTASATTGNTDSISAAVIFNAAGGSINTFTGGGGLVGADVALAASNSLTNAGTIWSAHNLNITSPNISNTGTMTAGTGNINVGNNGPINLSGNG